MPTRDFFVFCTSLHPLELRAIGALSEVRHLPAEDKIYGAGESADTLYIINRGTVEIEQADPNRPASACYLSRGEIFGDLELLAERPRQETARTREPVSLQCFQRQDFAELLRRVPSFFRFLCDHLAYRLIDARHAALSQIHNLELKGSLTNFDLITIYQTIAQSFQTGQLSIVNRAGQLIAAFHFESGQPVAGHFQHLTGEEAFWQLFLAEDLRGTFSFSSGEQKKTAPHGPAIARKANDMLFAAIQSRDEFQELRDTMMSSATLELQKPGFALGPSDTAISHSLIEQIWRCCAERPTALSGLYPHFSVCELKLYQAVRELMRTAHLALSAGTESQNVA